MITAYGNQVGDSENPVDSILNKPFTMDNLREAIAMLLPKSQIPPIAMNCPPTG
jgi:hypothetical protein